MFFHAGPRRRMSLKMALHLKFDQGNHLRRFMAFIIPCPCCSSLGSSVLLLEFSLSPVQATHVQKQVKFSLFLHLFLHCTCKKNEYFTHVCLSNIHISALHQFCSSSYDFCFGWGSGFPVLSSHFPLDAVFFCLQLEAYCSQLSFFAYSCVREFFCLQLEFLLLTIGSFSLTIEAPFLLTARKRL